MEKELTVSEIEKIEKLQKIQEGIYEDKFLKNSSYSEYYDYNRN